MKPELELELEITALGKKTLHIPNNGVSASSHHE